MKQILSKYTGEKMELGEELKRIVDQAIAEVTKDLKGHKEVYVRMTLRPHMDVHVEGEHDLDTWQAYAGIAKLWSHDFNKTMSRERLDKAQEQIKATLERIGLKDCEITECVKLRDGKRSNKFYMEDWRN